MRYPTLARSIFRFFALIPILKRFARLPLIAAIKRAALKKIHRRSPSSFTGGVASIRHDAIGGLATDQLGAGLPPGIDVVVPVCNAARWINAICDGYDGLRLRPLFIVEARSSDDSLAILLGRNARAFTAQGEMPDVESLLSGIIPYFSSSWILRLDDDELPSSAMLRWVAGNVSHLQAPSVAFPRYSIYRNGNGGLGDFGLRGDGGPWKTNYQYRLFRPSDVAPKDTLHSPGFDASFELAPDEARIYHFDWIVHTYDERRRKTERYEELEKGNRNSPSLLSPGRTGSRDIRFHSPRGQPD